MIARQTVATILINLAICITVQIVVPLSYFAKIIVGCCLCIIWNLRKFD